MSYLFSQRAPKERFSASAKNPRILCIFSAVSFLEHLNKTENDPMTCRALWASFSQWEINL
jgi:hypothetical protein